MSIFVPALLVLLAQPTPTEMPHPQVAVKAFIWTSRVENEFISPKERQQFLRYLEEQVATEARKSFPCMDWQVGVAVSQPLLRAELWVALVDNNEQEKPRVLIELAGPFPPASGSRLPQEKLKELVEFNRLPSPMDPVVDELDYAGQRYGGRLTPLQESFRGALRKHFGEQSFEQHFESNFVGNVVITDRPEFDDEYEMIIVPIAARRIEPGASLRLDLEETPLCKKGLRNCRIILAGQGPSSGKWPGALQCNAGHCDGCKGAPKWSELKDGTSRARRSVVYLEKHAHSRVKKYRYWEAP